MNFFGHAWVAARVSRAPGFVFGAMVPDLVLFAGLPLGPVEDPDVREGVAFHHSVDAGFHAGAGFLHLYAGAVRTLRAAGLPRGPARAASHLGIELLLDGELGDDADAVAAFRDALAWARAGARPVVGATSPEQAARWARVLERTGDGAIPGRYREPAFVAARLAGALATRAALALDPSALPVLEVTLGVLGRDVRAGRDALVAPCLALADARRNRV